MAQLKDTIINGSLIINDKPFFDWLYPVGCLYWSSKPTNPSELFAGTTWKQITDKFIFAQGSKAVDTEGGNENIKLTVEQLPSHTHSINHTHTMSHTHNISHTHDLTPQGSLSDLSFTGTKKSTESAGNHSHRWPDSNVGYSTSNTGTLVPVLRPKSGRSSENVSNPNIYTQGVSSHSHYYTPSGTVSGSFKGSNTTTSSQSTTTSGEASNSTTSQASTTTSGSTGSSSDINIMPPYVVKYCWERTA